jgi:hypothetical protein
MIKVTVELIPHGDESKKRSLGSMTIINNRTGDINFGNYDYSISKWAPKEKQTWKKGNIERFDRVNRGVWDLMYNILSKTVGKRNKNSNL